VYTAWSSMGTGYVSKEDMEMEHSKWVEEIEHDATDVQETEVVRTEDD